MKFLFIFALALTIISFNYIESKRFSRFAKYNSHQESCIISKHCSKDKGLKCINNKCQCIGGSSWKKDLSYCVLDHMHKCESADNSSSSSEEKIDRCDSAKYLVCDKVSSVCLCAKQTTWSQKTYKCEHEAANIVLIKSV
ncbi:unnamed protein product [Brachionus calyciflorus]|uniref:Uncharacterized protein n=1 Tax=Brachionus calyciflorus TaxID=104777 RepID=A0A814KJ12_9BILA|nr:unnamed protein product [Brachionus calyciflorus]